MIEHVGSLLAIGGSIVAVYGVLIFNLRNDYTGAKIVWAISNPMLLLWAVGYIFGWWDGALSVVALAALYAIYTVTNWYGLWKK